MANNRRDSGVRCVSVESYGSTQISISTPAANIILTGLVDLQDDTSTSSEEPIDDSGSCNHVRVIALKLDGSVI